MDNMKIFNALDESIITLLKTVNHGCISNEEEQAEIDAVTQLCNAKGELFKLETERIVAEAENKKMEAVTSKENRIDNLKIALDVVGMVLPLILYDSWYTKGLEFEKEGMFTSSTLKVLYNKFKPTL